MAYATYTFYTGTYGGTMPETVFDVFSVRASRQMDLITFDRTKAAPAAMSERLQLCCCALSDLLKQQASVADKTLGGVVASASNDGYSESYVNGQALTQQCSEAIRQLCLEYLASPVNLMYRGC